MRRASFIGLLVGATALLSLWLPAIALAGTYSWDLPANFTASPPGANPDHDAYGASPWRYVESGPGGALASHVPSTFHQLTQFARPVRGGLAGWTDPSDASALVAVNPSPTPVTNNGDTFAANRLVMVPAPDRFVAVGWTSPLAHPAKVTITGTINTAGGAACPLGASWSLDQNGFPVETNVTGGSTISASPTVPAGGTIYLTVEPGALSIPSCAASNVTLHITETERAAPLLTLDSPANGALISGGQPVFAGSASHDFGASSNVTIRVYPGTGVTGTPIQTITTKRSGGAYSAAPRPPLSNGTYTAQAEQLDLAAPPDVGLSSPVSFTVQIGGTPGPGGTELIRTFRIAPPGVDPNGPSAEPSISANDRYVAFASVASNLGPAVGTSRLSNVYLFDLATGRVQWVSAGLHGAPANGASLTPSISADGRVIAFASTATNLVAGTPRHVSDIFVRAGGGPIRLLSVAFGGVQPDSASTQPVVSADGRFVAFSSTADNLIAGDDNADSDVFVADLATGAIRRVSVSSAGAQARGGSYNPSISGDGRLVSFTSAASNLVRGDHNRVADVFVHDRLTGSTKRISVSSRGREQNASVASPFTQISGLSADGHYIVFDSDASNLVRGDNNSHTDVFRHSLVNGDTTLVSRNSRFQQGNNDSFAPSTSGNGRVTAFESFADNLAAPFAPSESVFAQDLSSDTTLMLDVAPNGAARGPELDPQLLQRPAVSADGQVVVFSSGADNLVPNDYNGTDDLFARVIVAPATSVVVAPPAQTTDRRPLVEFRGNNPLASFGLCILDGRRQICPLGRRFRLRALKRGAHVLKVLAGAPGTLFDPHGVTVNFAEV